MTLKERAQQARDLEKGTEPEGVGNLPTPTPDRPDSGAESPAVGKTTTRGKSKATDGRRNNGRPMAESSDRPLCTKDPDHGLMYRNGTTSSKRNPNGPKGVQYRCRTCGAIKTISTRAALPPGNRPGQKITGPGHRRGDDYKGKRIDELTVALEEIVSAKPRTTELAEALLRGREVLAKGRDI